MSVKKFDLKPVLLDSSAEDVAPEILDLSPALLRSRRASDADLREAVMGEITDHPHYRRINEVLACYDWSEPDVQEEIRSVLLNSRLVLAAAVGNHSINEVLIQKCRQLEETLTKDSLTGLWSQNAFLKYVKQLFKDKENMYNL